MSLLCRRRGESLFLNSSHTFVIWRKRAAQSNTTLGGVEWMKGRNEVFINSCLICVLRWHRSPQCDVFLWKYEACITGEGSYYFRGFRCTLFKQAALVKVYYVILDGDIDVRRLIHCCFCGRTTTLFFPFFFLNFTPFEEHLVFAVLYGCTLEIY